MIDLKNVISLIEIIYLKKVSCIVRKKGGDDKNWSVVFEGENEFKNIKLTDKDIEMVNKFRILSV
jgi:hypothetical protein